MKQETIESGAFLLKAIKCTQEAKEALRNINVASFREESHPIIATIRFADAKCKGYFEKITVPEAVCNIMSEELNRYIARVRRKLDQLEHELKEELEDLT